MQDTLGRWLPGLGIVVAFTSKGDAHKACCALDPTEPGGAAALTVLPGVDNGVLDLELRCDGGDALTAEGFASAVASEGFDQNSVK